MTSDGRVYHLDLKAGEISNKIILVGDIERAKRYANLYLEKGYFTKESHRGFYTCTGNYKGQRVSIVGTGMGIAMIDFSIREIRHLFGPKEKLFMIRLGTCGSPQHNIGLGTVVVNDSSIFISRNPDAFRKVSTQGKIPEVQTAYRLSLPCKSNENLTQLLYENMKKIIGEQHVIVGLNATADSFYSSQGRRSTFFVDSNEELIDYVISKYQVCSLEMESFHLFDMADCSLGSICATSAELVLAQRRTNEFIDPELRANRECQLGLAGLETLIQL
jgi:uridine phosphorylase